MVTTTVLRCSVWSFSSSLRHACLLRRFGTCEPQEVRVLPWLRASISCKDSPKVYSISSFSSASLDEPEISESRTSEDEEDDEYSVSHHSHTPVLLSEVLSAFRGLHLHTFLDCTLGAAGHASSIIKDHPELQTFVGLDVDPRAHLEASLKLRDAIEHRGNDSSLKLHIHESNFRNLKSSVQVLGLADVGVDGILMDLGMSSMQLDSAERGFSLQHDGPLDMRMDPLSSLTASDILNTWPETEIGRILREYGEERQWKRLAQRISEAQLQGGLHSTSQLLQLIQKSLPFKFSPGRPGWRKTAVRVFQALRIAVNDELSALEGALPDAFNCLNSKGRLAVISFHSLEDRLVKQFFLKAKGESIDVKSHYDRESRYMSFGQGISHSGSNSEGETRRGNKVLEGRDAVVLTRRPLIASVDEVRENSRSRSAKLRILEKK